MTDFYIGRRVFVFHDEEWHRGNIVGIVRDPTGDLYEVAVDTEGDPSGEFSKPVVVPVNYLGGFVE